MEAPGPYSVLELLPGGRTHCWLPRDPEASHQVHRTRVEGRAHWGYPTGLHNISGYHYAAFMGGQEEGDEVRLDRV